MKNLVSELYNLFTNYIFILLFCFAGQVKAQPKVCITIDDGSIKDIVQYENETWNRMLLDTLAKYNLQAAFFVKAKTMEVEKGVEVVRTWDNAGHLIANHTHSHKNFNGVPLAYYKKDFLRCDSFIRQFKNYTRLFRFPYLKAGNTKEKVEGFNSFLEDKKYKRGYVTIDASDWYINDRLVKALKKDSTTNLKGYRQYYVQHLMERALYYDSLAKQVTGKHIPHTLLIHHNLAAALFLGDLIKAFKANGWEVIDASTAYKDPIYKNKITTVPSGESLIWALAKQSDIYSKGLRYPAESGSYEKQKMDNLGL